MSNLLVDGQKFGETTAWWLPSPFYSHRVDGRRQLRVFFQTTVQMLLRCVRPYIKMVASTLNMIAKSNFDNV